MELCPRQRLITCDKFNWYRTRSSELLHFEVNTDCLKSSKLPQHGSSSIFRCPLSPDMAFFVELNKFILQYVHERVRNRRHEITRTIESIVAIINDVLSAVESLEPRFISSFKKENGRYAGLRVITSTRFELRLFLNQMGVFNFIDDNCPPGCAMLKLSDERKRSMSLWTEFITASGYLSARKMRARFHSLVAEAAAKCSFREQVRVQRGTSSTMLVIRDQYTLNLVPAFKCGAIWPRNVCVWPTDNQLWPSQSEIEIVKRRGFNLLAGDMFPGYETQAAEGDAWILDFSDGEDVLLRGSCRKQCLAILKTLFERHLDLPGKPIQPLLMKTLLLYECEKHPREDEWDETSLGERVNGILLQLVSCLQCRRCPHFFLKGVDLFVGKSREVLNNAAHQAWKLTRAITTNPNSTEIL